MVVMYQRLHRGQFCNNVGHTERGENGLATYHRIFRVIGGKGNEPGVKFLIYRFSGRHSGWDLNCS